MSSKPISLKFDSSSSQKIGNENQLLDDIEKSTKRLHGQSKHLNEEATSHVHLLGHMKNDMETANDALFKQAQHAELVRQTSDGVCWMYGVICGELFLLITLIYWGMS